MTKLIKIIAVGQKLEEWVNIAFSIYQKRLRPHLSFELVEIAAKKRHHSHLIKKIMKEESAQLLDACKPPGLIIALDRCGKRISTEAMAKKISQTDTPIHLLIGGPEGIDEETLNKCNEVWSISDLTLPHPMVRIILVEQIYRSISLLNNHPYHRGPNT